MEYERAGHPERPDRIRRTLARLRHQQDLPLAWAEPLPVADESLLRAHSAAHLERVAKAAADFDADTPAHERIAEHARRAVGGGLRALKAARSGQAAFSLMRPPGHHATRDQAMGFCYFNSVAVAALEAVAHGMRRVAVFDFDVHHGNGTEAILLYHPHAAFFSVHQHPCYPQTGARNVGDNCFNFPVRPHTPRAEWRAVLGKALDAVRAYRPDMVAVSAGFDAYVRDTIAEGSLEAEDYRWLGKLVAGLRVPTFTILEGGYSDDLPELILAFLKGWDGR
jgi:acetoin utilization deacetylase AcuC-like enzyme